MAGARFSKVRSSQNVNGPGTVQTGSDGRAFFVYIQDRGFNTFSVT